MILKRPPKIRRRMESNGEGLQSVIHRLLALMLFPDPGIVAIIRTASKKKNPGNRCGIGGFGASLALGELGRATGGLEAVLQMASSLKSPY